MFFVVWGFVAPGYSDGVLDPVGVGVTPPGGSTQLFDFSPTVTPVLDPVTSGVGIAAPVGGVTCGVLLLGSKDVTGPVPATGTSVLITVTVVDVILGPGLSILSFSSLRGSSLVVLTPVPTDGVGTVR